MAETATKVVTILLIVVLISSYLLEMFGADAAGINVRKPVPMGPPVQLMSGTLRPRELISRNGLKYFGFLGVPYASPPVGNMRYGSPSTPTPWKGILEAVEYRSQCIQYNIGSEKVEGDEDCLYLNVFTPKLPNKTKIVDEDESNPLYPVIVYFHSGAFMFGSAATYDARYFMDEEVVLVTVGYRLGSFGFLNTGDETVSGNMGLKDQVMALKWVNENIHHFNGDKDVVTLMGESSGGASAHYHMLSPMSKGLFHRAISMSGTALCPWAFRRDPQKQAKRLAAMVNCPFNDMQEMVFCLQTKNATQLAWKHKELFEWNTDPISPFAPSVESSMNEMDVFLKDTPYMLIQKGQFHQVPWIVGVTDQVCLLDAASILKTPKLLAEINQDWYRIAPLTFDYRDTALLTDAVSNQIRSFYFGTKPIGPKTETNLTNVYSDRYFGHCTRVAALLHKKINEGSPVFLYSFSFKAPMRSHLGLLGINSAPGVSEGDELSYLFHMDGHAYKSIFPEIKNNTKYHDFSKRFVALWVSFATTGTPAKTWGPAFEWKSIQPDEVKGDVTLKYYRIDNRTSVIDEPNAARMTFWDNLPLNEYEDEMSVYSRSDGAPGADEYDQ